jgi:hydroxymethylpyrimidine kinase / phosphomethylpyrimidine kinase / thiamine-phosphate diphosphorylase
MKKVICVGGNDSSGGAGLDLDKRILSNLRANFTCVATANTIQTHKEFLKSNFVDQQFLKEQLQEAFPKDSCIVKIGMIGSFENLKILFEFLSNRKDFIILDPILFSTTGGELLEKDGISFLKKYFFPLVDLLTPNLDELSLLLDGDTNPRELFKFGIKNILLKGGHEQGSKEFVDDYFFSRDGEFKISSIKIKRDYSTRGTGCALASALAFGLSSGISLKEALIFAKINLSKNLRLASFDQDVFVMYPNKPFEMDLKSSDMPFVNLGLGKFPDLGIDRIQVYPIVDRADFLKKLEGIKIAQLRIKDLSGDELEVEIKKAIEISNLLGIKLFINDYFHLAKKYKAFGIHLGQEDLPKYDRLDLLESGLRLGISTHSYFELAIALGYKPSYIAFGPIYFTTLKAMSFAPQGVEKLKIIRKLVEVPLVAIGGITLEGVDEVLDAQVDFISVVSDISKHLDPSVRVKQWLGALQ